MQSVLKNIVTTTLPVLLILLLVLEMVFRFAIPAASRPNSYFDAESLIYRYDSSSGEGLYTIGPLARQQGRWRINNYGWNSPIDYRPEKNRERIAVIGDSYVEAFQVDVDKSYPALLGGLLERQYDVYSFGKSGAPLSQYLHMSRYVNRIFDPDVLVLNIVHNDFEESLWSTNPLARPWMTLSLAEDTVRENPPREAPSLRRLRWLQDAVKSSAVFRYVYYNLKVEGVIRESGSGWRQKTKPEFEANVDVRTVRASEERIGQAVRYILRRLKLENASRRLILVMDGLRYAIYNRTLENNQLLFLHRLMKRECAKQGIEFIDLTDAMRSDYALNGVKFNSDYDGHWDEYGHRFVASRLREHLAKH